ncbi:MAG: pyridoxamine 5'-phosphate oxidase family protein [Bacteroidales bacterium]|nr:pyridoxamine 5'-phosphate oxidase family protein [Bacteroidales bacterium]
MRHRVLSSHTEIVEIIKQCQVCHVSMVDPNGKPYVVPMNFGFDEDVIYLHSAQEGKKIDCLRSNPEVCINFTTDHVLRYQHEQVACSWGMKYRSVLCYGSVEFIEDETLKRKALDVLMKQYTERPFTYNDPSIREVSCWIVKVKQFDARVYGY